MPKEERASSLSAEDLEWRKTEGYIDRYAEMVTVNASTNSVILDFGSFDHQGRTKEDKPKDPHIALHTRIRVSPEHFKSIVSLLNRISEKMEKGADNK